MMLRRKRRQRGQALVELCLIIPVCLTLFMGVYTAGVFISDLDVAGQAVRAGARLGAEVGDCGYASGNWQCSGSSTTNPATIDGDIVTNVVTIAKGLQNASSLDEIDIYDPCWAAGSCSTPNCSDAADIGGAYNAGEPADVYKLVGGTWTLQSAGSGGYYTLDLRSQAHPNEHAIGVRLVYHFKASAPLSIFNMQTSQFATMCFAPYESGG